MVRRIMSHQVAWLRALLPGLDLVAELTVDSAARRAHKREEVRAHVGRPDLLGWVSGSTSFHAEVRKSW